MKESKIKINYFYFSFMFLFIAFSTTSNVLAVETIKQGYLCYFIFHCFAQALLEMAFLILLTSLFELFSKKSFFYLFLSLSFFLFLTHVIDFVLIRFMDLGFWDALSIMLDETLANFIELLILAGISPAVWVAIGITLLILPVLGVYLYKITNKFSDKKPLAVRSETLLLSCFCIISTLLFFDFSSAPTIRPDIFQAYQNSLPWKTTFLKNKKNIITVKNHLKKPPVEKAAMKSISKVKKLKKKPNIYLFVVESIRNDFITSEIAPALYQFKEENYSLPMSFSNSNNTHCSWFSIFHSYYPFYWSHMKGHGWKSGSLPLNILKKAGYDIHVMSASGLHFYKMNELLFGKKRELLTTYYCPKEEPYLADKLVFEKAPSFKKTQGNVFIIFLDSTHFNYSWPPNFELKFLPILEKMHNFSTYNEKEIKKITNRYRNAINYVDSLFNNFFETLKKRNAYTDSIVVITGDHGEEFFEKGHLFHASDLSNVQTQVPILYKFSHKKRAFYQKNTLTSQVDILPTVLDFLFDEKYSFFHGRSLFSENLPFVVSTRFSGSRTPHEFFLHDGKNKLNLRFVKKDIFSTKELQILNIRDKCDEIYHENFFHNPIFMKETNKTLEMLFSK